MVPFLPRSLRAAVLALPLMLPLALPALADTPATITVTGRGAVEAVPDMAVLSLGVTTSAVTAAEAMAANSAALKAVIDRLTQAGFAERDVQTSNLSLNPNWEGQGQDGAPLRIASYTASNQVMIRVRDLATLGTVLDAVVTDGANTMNGLSFGLSEPRPAEDAALRAAVEDARAKAELMASAAGVQLGRILSVSEQGGYAPPMPMFRADAMMAEAVPIAPGEISTQASVTIVWELEQ
jgi:uncharacterized protein YggE